MSEAMNEPAQTKSVHLQLPASLLAQVDHTRSDAPRNAWIRRAIQQRLERETTPRPRGRHPRTSGR